MTPPTLRAIARVLELIDAVPNRRAAPLPNDIPGEFDYWFDGGALRMTTGQWHFTFADGTTAYVQEGVNATVVGISFPDGTVVNVGRHQRAAALPAPPAPPLPSAPPALPPGDFESLGVRPERGYCIFCGWRFEAGHAGPCASCLAEPPSVEGATMEQCSACGRWTFAMSSFCQWCGAYLRW